LGGQDLTVEIRRGRQTCICLTYTVKGRKRHIMVDTLGLLVANRVEPADTSDRRAGALLLGGLSALFPRIRTVIADAGHQSRKLARTLKQETGSPLRETFQTPSKASAGGDRFRQFTRIQLGSGENRGIAFPDQPGVPARSSDVPPLV